jgi:transposase
LHTGAPWRDLPERYGTWQTVLSRFHGWRREGTWVRSVTALWDELDDQGGIDHDLWCIDGTVVRASRAATGAGKKDEQCAALGRDCGKLNTSKRPGSKIVDAWDFQDLEGLSWIKLRKNFRTFPVG